MPRLVMVGLSHHAAPLEVRERAAIDEATWREYAPESIGTVLISTCNRLEVYAWVEGRSAPVVRTVQRALARAAGIDSGELQPYLSSHSGRAALLHLVRVTSGLDSLVVGEEQIRGQVRAAVRAGEVSGPLPPLLRGIFQRAGESARRIRGGTQLGAAPSIAAAGVNVALRFVAGDVHGQLAVVLGAGVMARAATEALLACGARVRVLNRTPAHAERLLEHFGPRVERDSLGTLRTALSEALLVVGATASPTPVVSLSDVQAALPARASRPLVLLDIALPRDVDRRAREVPQVTLLDLDDLEAYCPVDAATRAAEHRQAEALAADEADRIARWLRFRAVSPAIAELRTYAETVRRTELQRSAARLRGLTADELAAVEALTAGIVNKLMHGPTIALRDSVIRPGGLGRARILRVVHATRARHG